LPVYEEVTDEKLIECTNNTEMRNAGKFYVRCNLNGKNERRN
jgi:hypothetical protein